MSLAYEITKDLESRFSMTTWANPSRGVNQEQLFAIIDEMVQNHFKNVSNEIVQWYNSMQIGQDFPDIQQIIEMLNK